ncbi:unnamed protein product [Prorocentrum cordatum]|uniref:Arf-GAP domain-containing protein n=1 Tax=Prorocentrum cordatum TaxID=2364126 RepID=A0ABN9U3C0_9DINO|nr:unnamed protein product [Polarella glacialis]
MASTQMWKSKLGNWYPKHEIDRLDQEHHQMLKALRMQGKNSRCAECAAADTCWASVNLGVFVCVRCSDVHRAVGTHISVVKGCSGTYLWGPDELARMRDMGNAHAETLYGHRHKPLPESASKEDRVKACEFKYGKGPAAATAAAAPAAQAPPRQAPCAAEHSVAAGGATAADGPMALRPAPCAAEDPSAPTAACAWRAAVPPPRRAASPPRPRAAALEAPGADELRSLEAAEAAGGGEAVCWAPSSGQPAAPCTAVAAADLDAFLYQCLQRGGEPAQRLQKGGKRHPSPRASRRRGPAACRPRTTSSAFGCEQQRALARRGVSLAAGGCRAGGQAAPACWPSREPPGRGIGLPAGRGGRAVGIDGGRRGSSGARAPRLIGRGLPPPRAVHRAPAGQGGGRRRRATARCAPGYFRRRRRGAAPGGGGLCSPAAPAAGRALTLGCPAPRPSLVGSCVQRGGALLSPPPMRPSRCSHSSSSRSESPVGAR